MLLLSHVDVISIKYLLPITPPPPAIVTVYEHGRHVRLLVSRAAGGPKYSRLDSEVSAMQRNSATYCDEPQDAAEFAAWLQVCLIPCIVHLYKLYFSSAQVESLTHSKVAYHLKQDQPYLQPLTPALKPGSQGCVLLGLHVVVGVRCPCLATASIEVHVMALGRACAED